MAENMENRESLLERQATLVIGLGGAGGQVVARIKNTIQSTFGADSVKARNVHYLVMDNEDFPNLEPIVRQTINETSEFLCLSRFNPREAYKAYESSPETMADLRVWFPPEDIDMLPNKVEDTGAARCRPLGRFFLYHNREKARKRILEVVSQALTGVPEARKLRVILVHSCLGGSGSSAMLDVVYMLKLILQAKKVEGTFYDFVLLPELFIETACRGQPALEEFLKANAFAFFREMDYLQKNPDKFNEWAMDAVSAGRMQPGRGLERGQEPPFTMVYLIDSVIPEGSVGQFASLNDLFDYTRTCIYYTMFCEPVVSGFDKRVCNAEGINAKDSKWGRTLRYSAVGVSEIRRPRELLREWYALKARRDLLQLCLGDEREISHDAVLASMQGLIDGIPVFNELQQRMNAVVDSVVKKLPTADLYLVSDSKVNWEEATAANFQSAITAAARLVENARVDLARAYGTFVDTASGTFRNGLLAFLNTWGNFRGLFFCKRVLDQYNLHLEGSIPVHLQSVQQKKREAEKLREDLEKLADSIRKPLVGSGDNAGKIQDFTNALQQYVRAALQAETHAWLAELTRVCAGDPEGKDPSLQIVDPDTGKVASAKNPTHSILDTLVDTLNSRILEMQKLHMQDIHLEFQRRLNQLGHSPASIYLPDIFGTQSLEDSSVLWPYHQAYPVFSGVGDRQKLFEDLFRRIRELEPECGNFDRWSLWNSSQLLERFSRIGKRLIAEINTQNKKDLLSAMGNRVAEYMGKLNNYSTPVLRCTKEKVIHPQDKKRIQELHFLGAESQDLISEAKKQNVRVDENCEFLLDEGIVHIHTFSIFPYLISDSLRGMEAAYVYRTEDVRPHFSNSLNNGSLDDEDPLTIGKRPPLETYIKMWALTYAMDSNAQVRNTIQERLSMKMCHQCQGRHPTFFFFEQNRNHPHYGLNAIYWNVDGYTLTQDEKIPSIHIYSKLFTIYTDRQDVYHHYAKEYGILQCHENILYLFENDNAGLPNLLYDALKEYLTVLEKSYTSLVASQEYMVAQQKELENRSVSPNEKVLVENAKFLLRMIRTLKRLIEFYEAHYGINQTVSYV